MKKNPFEFQGDAFVTDCSHTWLSSIYDRLYNGAYCPYCNGRLEIPGLTSFEAKHSEGRYEFIGDIAPAEVQERYKNMSVSNLFKKGEQSPFKYFIDEK